MKKRVSTKVKSKLNSISSKLIDTTIDTTMVAGIMFAKTYIADAISNKYYRQIELNFSNEPDMVYCITENFLHKYDKNFKKLYNHNNMQMPRLLYSNTIKLINPIKNTYIVIITGHINHNNYSYKNKETSQYDLTLIIFGERTNELYAEMMQCIVNVYGGKLGIYTVRPRYKTHDNNASVAQTGTLDISFIELDTRDINTLYFSNNETEKCISHIDSFLANRSFYQARHLLYKTGILLYGKPGTGKSTLVKALATYYNRSIINIDVNNIEYLDLITLTNSMNTDHNEYIVLFEDIDTLFLNRDSEINNNKVINKLLQFIDSNVSPSRVIFIATTNHIDRLDNALLREGRFDIKVNVDQLDEDGAYRFGESFELSRVTMKDIIDDLKNELDDNQKISKYMFNQSKLQVKMLAKIKHRNDNEIRDIFGDSSSEEIVN